MSEANVLFEFYDANLACSNPLAVLCGSVYSTGGPLEGCDGQFTYNQVYTFCVNLKKLSASRTVYVRMTTQLH